MYDALMDEPTKPKGSNCFDQFVKFITGLVGLAAIGLSITLTYLHLRIDTGNSVNAIQDQIGLIGYISSNIATMPIKNVTFRNKSCLSDESPAQLFPWTGNTSLRYWNSQVLCFSRYRSLDYTDKSSPCPGKATKCGYYCVPESEGTLCPITEIDIKPLNATNVTATPPDQNLTNGRVLLLKRSPNSKGPGIYRVEVDVDGLPCQNDRRRYLGGLPSNNTFLQQCDQYGTDQANTEVIEKQLFSLFLDDNMAKLKQTYTRNQIKPSSLAWLVERESILFQYKQCPLVDPTNIQEIQNSAENIAEIGLIYLIIRANFSLFVGLLILMECVNLRCKMYKDDHIVSALMKLLTMLFMLIFVIEGGLVVNQLGQKQDVEQYYQKFGKLGCFPQHQVNSIFQNFPDLFGSDVSLYMQFAIYSMLGGAGAGGFLLVLYSVQICRWCLTSKHKLIEPRRYADDDFNRQVSVKFVRSHEDMDDGTPQFEMTKLAEKERKQYEFY